MSKIEENGKTFALMPPRPRSGMTLNDDDESCIAFDVATTPLFPFLQRHFYANLAYLASFVIEMPCARSVTTLIEKWPFSFPKEVIEYK